jgi:hypothetical protein
LTRLPAYLEVPLASCIQLLGTRHSFDELLYHHSVVNTNIRRIHLQKKESLKSLNIGNDLSILPVAIKGIVSPDWKGLHMFSLDRFEV